MKKKTFISIGICLVVSMAVVSGILCVSNENRKNAPYGQIAEKIYNVENALKEVDENWELKSLSTVTPYTYATPEGDTIIYYHCRTSYFTEEKIKLDGLNATALQQVVDIETLENSRGCDVKGMTAILGEAKGRSYLCWTINPENSCVIEYTASSFPEEDIFRMAESVQLPACDDE